MSGDCPVTVTVSSTLAIFMDSPMSSVWPTFSVRPLCSTLLNPCSSATTS